MRLVLYDWYVLLGRIHGYYYYSCNTHQQCPGDVADLYYLF